MRLTLPVVYVAGPYSAPDPCVNTHRAIQAADQLLDMGFAPLVPHLSHLWHTVSPKDYSVWMEIDLALMLKCDAVYRLGGESPGADAEEVVAREAGLPVFTNFPDAETWLASRAKESV